MGCVRSGVLLLSNVGPVIKSFEKLSQMPVGPGGVGGASVPLCGCA